MLLHDLCSSTITVCMQFPLALVANPQGTKRQAVDAIDCQYPPEIGVLDHKTLNREVIETPSMRVPIYSKCR